MKQRSARGGVAGTRCHRIWPKAKPRVVLPVDDGEKKRMLASTFSGQASSDVLNVLSSLEKLYSVAQSRQIDRAAAQQPACSGSVLMERAGAAAFAFLRSRWPQAQRLGVLCGAGNNGGDGYVLARLARTDGLRVRLAAVAGLPRPGSEADTARQGFIAGGGVEESVLSRHAGAGRCGGRCAAGHGPGPPARRTGGRRHCSRQCQRPAGAGPGPAKRAERRHRPGAGRGGAGRCHGQLRGPQAGSVHRPGARLLRAVGFR